jgi:hypothetical protein
MIPFTDEGILFRGPDLVTPLEVWDHARKRWVTYHGGPISRGTGEAVDAARAEVLKVDNPAAEHFFYYDDPPWRQPLGEAYHQAMLTPAIREAIARRQAQLAKARGA